jgi:hypothetical protein
MTQADNFAGFIRNTALNLPQWDTAGRPTEVTGLMGYNTSLGAVEYYNGNDWVTSAGVSIAWQSVQTTSFTALSGSAYPVNTSGGAVTVTLPASPSLGDLVTITDYNGAWATNNLTINPNGNKINGAAINAVASTARQSLQLVYIDSTRGWIAYSGFNDVNPVQNYSGTYLLVAGGGGGGTNGSGGGGGGGGYLTASKTFVAGTTYTAVVGAGGAAGNGGAGGNSTLTGETTAVGGGWGAGHAAFGAGSGGSGGGGSYGATSPGSGTAGQGNNGGAGNFGNGGNTYFGGSGGSATAAGSTNSAGPSGALNTITGSSVYYSAGGGSLSYVNNGAVSFGTGTGGNGANSGGGGSYGNGGGSGVVILSVPTTNYSGITTGSPTITTNGSNTVIKFTSSGTYVA